MAWLIGQFIGSFIGVLLITLMLRAIFMKGKPAYVPIVTAVVISTVLYYFGGEGEFTIMYIISGVVIYETEKWMSK